MDLLLIALVSPNKKNRYSEATPVGRSFMERYPWQFFHQKNRKFFMKNFFTIAPLHNLP